MPLLVLRYGFVSKKQNLFFSCSSSYFGVPQGGKTSSSFKSTNWCKSIVSGNNLNIYFICINNGQDLFVVLFKMMSFVCLGNSFLKLYIMHFLKMFLEFCFSSLNVTELELLGLLDRFTFELLSLSKGNQINHWIGDFFSGLIKEYYWAKKDIF